MKINTTKCSYKILCKHKIRNLQFYKTGYNRHDLE